MAGTIDAGRVCRELDGHGVSWRCIDGEYEMLATWTAGGVGCAEWVGFPGTRAELLRFLGY